MLLKTVMGQLKCQNIVLLHTQGTIHGQKSLVVESAVNYMSKAKQLDWKFLYLKEYEDDINI